MWVPRDDVDILHTTDRRSDRYVEQHTDD